MEPQEQCKPTKYYIDFENVHGAGLKGIDEKKIPVSRRRVVALKRALGL